MNRKLLACVGVLAAGITLYKVPYAPRYLAYEAQRIVLGSTPRRAVPAALQQESPAVQPPAATASDSARAARQAGRQKNAEQRTAEQREKRKAEQAAMQLQAQQKAERAAQQKAEQRTLQQPGHPQQPGRSAEQQKPMAQRAPIQFSKQASLEDRCVLGPAIISSNVNGKTAQSVVYAASKPSQYTLHQGDELSILLPKLTPQQLAKGYSVKWLVGTKNSAEVNSILSTKRIEHAKLRSLGQLDGSGYVGLLKDGKLQSSYEVKIIAKTAETEQESVAQSTLSSVERQAQTEPQAERYAQQAMGQSQQPGKERAHMPQPAYPPAKQRTYTLTRPDGKTKQDQRIASSYTVLPRYLAKPAAPGAKAKIPGTLQNQYRAYPTNKAYEQYAPRHSLRQLHTPYLPYATYRSYTLKAPNSAMEPYTSAPILRIPTAPAYVTLSPPSPTASAAPPTAKAPSAAASGPPVPPQVSPPTQYNPAAVQRGESGVMIYSSEGAIPYEALPISRRSDPVIITLSGEQRPQRVSAGSAQPVTKEASEQ